MDFQTYKTELWTPTWKLSALEDLAEKLNRKAVKLGAAPMTMKVLRNKDRVIVSETGGKATRKINFSLVQITGEIPQIPGWTLLLGMERDMETKDRVLNAVFGPGQDDEKNRKFRTTPIRCDHCGHNRIRRWGYVLREDATGKEIMVGKTCVKDFTGHDPEKAMRLMSIHREFRSACEDEEWGIGGGAFSFGYDVEGFARVVVFLIRELGGYTKAGEGFSCTGDEAAVYIHDRSRGKDVTPLELTPLEEKRLSQVLESWKEIHGKGTSDVESLTSFEYKIFLFMERGFIRPKEIRIAGGAVSGALKRINQKEIADLDEKNGQKSEWFGNIGERLEFNLVLDRHVFIAAYDLNLYIGHVQGTADKVVWATGETKAADKFWNFGPTGSLTEFKKGKTFTVRATVKGHKDHPKFGKDTKVNRVSVLREFE